MTSNKWDCEKPLECQVLYIDYGTSEIINGDGYVINTKKNVRNPSSVEYCKLTSERLR